MGRPYSALAVGCTGKALFGVSGRLHWAIRLGLGTVLTLKRTTTRLGLGLGTISKDLSNFMYSKIYMAS